MGLYSSTFNLDWESCGEVGGLQEADEYEYKLPTSTMTSSV